MKTLEAKLIASRTGLRWQACQAWMIHAGIQSCIDLKDRYQGSLHAECMAQAAQEIEDYALGIVPLGITNPIAIDMAEMAKRLAAAPLLSPKPQLPCDLGLFSDDSLQTDLIEMLMNPHE